MNTETIHHGTASCGHVGQIFRTGKCANCYIADLEALVDEAKLGLGRIEEKLNPPCPKCGGETAVQRWLAHECSVGCDTSQRHCVECDWKGDPE